ncbi:hypothetical protein DEO72_LG6g685 [Vigna unguiculata]|uniref:Acyl-CoA-binding domain-containing protein n=1 Tax=Vigna unguiculata TaxID=3917 RepID=A0A4D6M7Y1_VIGUN|nr:hypothetical protein DEO72_LG6g685 [Vigna unguiculata]
MGCNEGVEKEVKNENFVIDDDDEYGKWHVDQLWEFGNLCCLRFFHCLKLEACAHVETHRISIGDIISVLKAEKEEMESSLGKEKQHALQLKQELMEVKSRNTNLESLEL